MTTKHLDTGPGFSAHVEIEDLEKFGWNFQDIYESVARSMKSDGMYSDELSGEDLQEAETQEKENYHVRIYNTGQGLHYIMCHNESGDVGDGRNVGDEKGADEDIQKLHAEGLLWEVFDKEPYYGYEGDEE